MKFRLIVLIALLVLAVAYTAIDEVFGQRQPIPEPELIQKTIDLYPQLLLSIEDFNDDGICSGIQPASTYQVESYHSMDIFVAARDNPSNVDCVRSLAVFDPGLLDRPGRNTVIDNLVLVGTFSDVVTPSPAFLTSTYYNVRSTAYKTAFNAAGAQSSASFTTAAGEIEIPLSFHSDSILRNDRLNVGMRFADEQLGTANKQALMSAEINDLLLRMTYTSEYEPIQVTDLRVTDTKITSPTIQWTPINPDDYTEFDQGNNNALDDHQYQVYRNGVYLDAVRVVDYTGPVTYVDNSIYSGGIGQSYVYTVLVNTDGTHSGVYDFHVSNSAVLITTPGDVDPDMINPAASNILENSALITWDVPELQFNQLTGGNIHLAGNGGEIHDIPISDPFAGRQLVTGLQSGRTYTITLQLSFNNQGLANQIQAIGSFNTPVVDPTRSDISLESVTDMQAHISINGFDPGSYVFSRMRINIEVLDQAGDVVSINFFTLFNQVTAYTIDNLTPGTDYSITVEHFVRDIVTGSQISLSSEALGFKTRFQAPDPINAISVTPDVTSILVEWQEPDLHGAVLAGYSVYLDGALTSTGQTSHTFTGLDRDTSHTIQVIAISDGLAQTGGMIVTTRTLTGLADQINFTANPAAEQIFMNWTIPESNGGTLNPQYTIYVDRAQHTTTGTEFTITRLRANTNYDIRVDSSTEYGVTAGVEQTVTTTRQPYALISVQEISPNVGGTVTGYVEDQNMLFRFSNTNSAVAYGVRCNGIDGIFLSNVAGFGQDIEIDSRRGVYVPHTDYTPIDSITGSHLLGSNNFGISEYRGSSVRDYYYVFPDREVLINNELFFRYVISFNTAVSTFSQPEGSIQPDLGSGILGPIIIVSRVEHGSGPDYVRLTDLDHIEFVGYRSSNTQLRAHFAHTYYFDFLPDNFQTIHFKKSSIVSGIADSFLELQKGDYLQILTDDPDNIAAFPHKVILNKNLTNTDYNLGDSGLNLVIIQSAERQQVNILNHNQGSDWTAYYHFTPVFNVGDAGTIEDGVIVLPEYYTSNESAVFCRGTYIYNELLGVVSVDSAGIELGTEYECKENDDFDLGDSDAAAGLTFSDIRPTDYCENPSRKFDRPIPFDTPEAEPVVVRRDMISYVYENVPITTDGQTRSGQVFKFILEPGFTFAGSSAGSGRSAASSAVLPCDTLNRFSGKVGVLVKESDRIAYNADPNSTGTEFVDPDSSPYYVKCTGLRIIGDDGQEQVLDLDISTFISNPYFRQILADIDSDIFGWGTGTNAIGSTQTIFGLPFIMVMALLSAMVGFNKQHLPAGIIIFITVIGSFAWLEIIDLPTAAISAVVMIGIIGLFSRGFK